MTRNKRWLHLLPGLCLFIAACGAPTRLAIDNERAALQLLERHSKSAADAIHAINCAREVVLNNLRNAQVTAFKGTQTVLLEGGRIEIRGDFSQGTMRVTGQEFDLAIEGPGFFMVKMAKPEGFQIGYLRAGMFFTNSYGEMVMAGNSGYTLNPPVTLPINTTSISISADGRVRAQVAGNPPSQEVAQIQLAQFVNPGGLLEMEPGIFMRTETSGMPMVGNPGTDGMGNLRQGALEESNVQIDRELVRLHLLDQWRDALLESLDMPRPVSHTGSLTEPDASRR